MQCTAFDTLVERLDEVAKIAKLRKKVQSDDKYSCLLGSDVYDKIVAAAKACKPQESRRKRSGDHCFHIPLYFCMFESYIPYVKYSFKSLYVCFTYSSY